MKDLSLSLESEALTVTLVALALAMLCEMRWPRRTLEAGLASRWRLNSVLAIAGMGLVSFALPMSSVTVAILAESRGLGFFHWLEWAPWLAGVLGFVLLDLVKYLQHWLMHRVSWLWRLHRAHHADFDCDATTSLRFHPFEMLIAQALELATILALGIPPLAVAIYRLIRTVVSTVVHGNFAFAQTVERVLCKFVATPDFHLLHHSQVAREQYSNLSGGLTLWDRLFGTYIAEPAHELTKMRLGIEDIPVARATSLRAMLNVFDGRDS